MKPKRIFNENRRKEIHDAVKAGDLKKILKRKHPGPGQGEMETLRTVNEAAEAPAIPPTLPSHLMPTTAPATQCPPMRPEIKPKLIEQSVVIPIDFPHDKIKEPDQALFDAIRENNLSKGEDAIKRGADVNGEHSHIPRHRNGDCIMVDKTTPLEYAKKYGRTDFIKLLKKCGAKG